MAGPTLGEKIMAFGVGATAGYLLTRLAITAFLGG